MTCVRPPRSRSCALLLLLAGTAAATAGEAVHPAELLAQDPIPLDGIVVTAHRVPRAASSLSSSATVVTRAEIEAEGLTTVAEALRGVAGVTVVQSGSFGATTSLFVRGAESDHVLVLIDGVQVNEPGGRFDLAGLTTENVERIEVVRGPGSALYGSDAAAAVVQIFTRAGSGPPALGLRVSKGSFGTTRWSASLDGGNALASYSASLTRAGTDGILAFNNRFRNTVFSGRVALRPDARTDASLSVRYGDRVFHFPTDGTGAVVDQNAFTFGDELTLALDVGRRIGSRVDLTLLATTHEVDTGSDDRPDGPADTLGFFGFTSLDNVRRAALDARADVELGTHLASVGAEVEHQSQRGFNESQSQFGPSSARTDETRWNRAGYAQVLLAWDAARVDVGGRVEDNERYGTSATGRLGVVVPVGASTELRASVGTGIKEPTFGETFSTSFSRGNPDLDPERSRSWEAGAAQGFLDGRGRITATWFDQRLKDLIQFTFSPPGPDDPNFFNVARVDTRGLELDASLVARGLRLGARYGWLDTEVVDSGFDEGPGATFVEGERLIRRPTHTASASVATRFGPAAVSARLRYVGEREDRDFATFPAEPVTLPSYWTVDVAGQVTVWPGGASGGPLVEAEARIENLFDESYEEAFGFGAPGRGVHVGVRVRLGGAPEP